jgi:hypothetical protein
LITAFSHTNAKNHVKTNHLDEWANLMEELAGVRILGCRSFAQPHRGLSATAAKALHGWHTPKVADPSDIWGFGNLVATCRFRFP